MWIISHLCSCALTHQQESHQLMNAKVSRIVKAEISTRNKIQPPVSVQRRVAGPSARMAKIRQDQLRMNFFNPFLIIVWKADSQKQSKVRIIEKYLYKYAKAST